MESKYLQLLFSLALELAEKVRRLSYCFVRLQRAWPGAWQAMSKEQKAALKVEKTIMARLWWSLARPCRIVAS